MKRRPEISQVPRQTRLASRKAESGQPIVLAKPKIGVVPVIRRLLRSPQLSDEHAAHSGSDIPTEQCPGCAGFGMYNHKPKVSNAMLTHEFSYISESALTSF
jgi:hypothetical protein